MKLSRIFVMMLLVMVLAACSDSSDAEEETDAVDAADSEEAVEEEEGGIEVDKGLLNVEVTIPAVIFDEEELAEIEADIQENGDADVTQNDDGSITIKMSKSDHNEMLAEMNDDFSNSIESLKEDDSLASIQDIEYNNDFTNMIVTVSDQASFEESFDGFAIVSLGFGSLFYQAFDGKDLTKDKVTIEVLDASTNEIIHEVIYPDALDEMEEAAS